MSRDALRIHHRNTSKEDGRREDQFQGEQTEEFLLPPFLLLGFFRCVLPLEKLPDRPQIQIEILHRQVEPRAQIAHGLFEPHQRHPNRLGLFR